MLCDPFICEPSPRDGSDEGSQHKFYAELIKIIPNYHQIPPLIYSSDTIYSRTLIARTLLGP